MSLTFTVIDNGDGTGGSCVVAGSAGGSTNSVYYASWTGVMQSYSYTLAGSRVGNGTLALALPVGYYQFQLVSNTTLGPLAYQNFSSTATTQSQEHKQILDAIQARINAIGLIDNNGAVPATRIIEKWVPRFLDSDLPYLPLVCIAPVGTETYPGMVTSEDDIVYPVLVSIVWKQNQDSVANMNTILSWRNKIAAAIRFQRLYGVTNVWTVTPKPGAVVDVSGFVGQNMLASHYSFGVIARQLRGLLA